MGKSNVNLEKLKNSNRVAVDKLANIISDAPSFIKIYFEGEKISEIEGARNTILTHHLRLAINVYYKSANFW